MTYDELRQAAIDYLGQSFKCGRGERTALQAEVVQAAVAILLTPEPKPMPPGDRRA